MEVSLHHLFFADDVSPFSKGMCPQFLDLSEVSNCLLTFLGCVRIWKNLNASLLMRTMQLSLSFHLLRGGELPICYLGLPLITGKLLNRDCIPLVNKLSESIEAWTCKFLNFGDHLQLITYVLSSIFWGIGACTCSFQNRYERFFDVKFSWDGYH